MIGLEFVVGNWVGGKVQFMLVTAWEMERVGHSGLSAFILLGELEETHLAVVELVRIGNMEELSELGKEIDGEAQQSCSLLEGGEGHQRGGYHLPPSKDDGPYGLHGLAVIVCLRPAVDSGRGG